MSSRFKLTKKSSRISKPDWLKIKLPSGRDFTAVRKNIDEHNLHTICESGKCPNMAECWGEKTATIMILGDVCTRSCRFCNVATGKPLEVDYLEPLRVAKSIKIMGLKHVVITSVDRDDLRDGGSEVWAATIRAIRKHCPGVTMETLIPDFKGNWENLQRVINEKPEVISHNLETVKRLTKKVRMQAKYERSLDVLQRLSEEKVNRTKSGIMLGLGETFEEIIETMQNLRAVNCQVLTLGQYLQPTKNHLPVAEYIFPETFKKLEKTAYQLGFQFVESGPLVRSSYHAEKHV